MMKAHPYPITQTRKHSLIILLALVLIFAIPFFTAWWLYKNHIHFSKPMNHGQLLNPPINLSELQFISLSHGQATPLTKMTKKWLLIYVAPLSCDTNCFHRLYEMRQIRLAVNADQTRVARLLVIDEKQDTGRLAAILQHDYPGTTLAILKQQPKKVALTSGFLYVADPLGNIILSYSPQTNALDVLNDLKRLLSVSQIG